MIHNFKKSNGYSHSKNDKMNVIYNNYFQCDINIDRIEYDTIENKNKQHGGLDTYITINNKMLIKSQEKWRNRKFTGDFLIEYASVYPDGSLKQKGWIHTIHADVIFAVYEPSDCMVVCPVKQLQEAYFKNSGKWIENYKIPPAHNCNDGVWYDTLNIAVPIPILKEAGCDTTIVSIDIKDIAGGN